MDQAQVENALIAQVLALKGGPGSGNWGHTSTRRIGQQGGSDPGGGLGAIGLDPYFEPTHEERVTASEQYRRARAAFPTYPMGSRAELAQELEGIRKLSGVIKKEVGFGIAPNGMIVARNTEGMSSRQLNVNPIVDAGANTIVHVHPSSSSFSDGDMAFFLSEPRVIHMMIVGGDGTIYRVSKTPKTPTPDQIVPIENIRRAFAGGATAPVSDMLYHQPGMVIQEVHASYVGMWRSYTDRERARWDAGEITKQQAVRNVAHRAMLDFSDKYALDYQVSPVGAQR